MVRLKGIYCHFFQVVLKKFQFLNGTIKRKHENIIISTLIMFQFLNGTIKRKGRDGKMSSLIMFQFLNGTIKSDGYMNGKQW